jgi:glycosyltransferase involved in cell wall biosynthesis
MRLAVYSDYSYRRFDGTLWAEMAFARFLAGLAPHVGGLTLVGRLDAQQAPWYHALPADIDFEPLPYYRALASPVEAGRTFVASLRRFWTLLDRVDAVWLLGPHPLAVGFALLAALRGRPVALGVRQDTVAYVRSRHPGSRGLLLAAAVLDGLFRLMARRCAVVAVGTDIARRYSRSRHLLPVAISLVSERDIAPSGARATTWDGELRVLSVGRLDAEKNPLLLADILARLVEHQPRWRLVVCGDGPLRGALDRRLRELGVRERADLVGYVPVEAGLLELYRSSHLLLHCSWTEGVPQVLYEAFAQRLPVVATDVGGVRDAADGAAVLVAPGDAEASAAALETLAGDARLRERLVEAGAARAREQSLEAGSERVARFLAEALAPGRQRRGLRRIARRGAFSCRPPASRPGRHGGAGRGGPGAA